MRFGFWFDYDHTYTFVSLYKALAERISDSSVSGFVVNDIYLAHAVDNLPPGSKLIRFYDLLAEAHKHVPDAAAIADFRVLDERYRLSRVAYSDRHLKDWRYEQLIGTYVYLIDAFRKYIDREKPDVFVFDAVASQHSHLLYLILVEKGVKVVIPNHIGVEDLFHIVDNPYQRYDRIWDLFKTMQVGANPPTGEERAWAERVIDRVRQGSGAYVNSTAWEQKKFALPGPRDLFRVAAYFKKYLLYYRFDPTLPNPWQRMKSILRLRHNRKKMLKYFRGANDIGENYAIYLLHFEPEIATLILSQYEQKSFIDIIVRQLPLSSRLVVKEHPMMVGQRDWRFYAELTRNYPNLVLVDPNAETSQLVRRARAVVTLSGTAIIEAFILQRPVIFTSKSRFGGFGFGSFTQEFLNFGEVLAASPRHLPSDEEIIKMLSAIHRSCVRCKFAEPLGDPDVLKRENIEVLASAILKHLSVG